jgi:hypothetical protein
MSKTFKPCLLCRKPVQQFPSKKRNFCCPEHYDLFIRYAKISTELSNEFLRLQRRAEQGKAF